ncbi:MAG: hypothetical protein ACFCVA_20140 [Gammaproteobacteria bacterium]
MRPFWLRSTVLSGLWLLLAACGDSTSGPREAIEERLEDLETRMATLEQRVAELAGVPEGDALPVGDDSEAVTQVSQQPSDPTQGRGMEKPYQVGQSVDFTQASEGQIFPQYGARSMIVKTWAGLGLTSASPTPVDLVFSDFSLADRIEVLVSIRTGFWTGQQINLLDDDRGVIAVTLNRYDLKFGDHVKKRNVAGWKHGEEQNQLRIVIENNNARLFVNRRFFGVQEIELAKANRLEINGIKRDQDFVYSVSVQPLS